MQCTHCGVALPADARFCAGCGRPVLGAKGPAANASTSKVILVVVLAAGGAMALGFLGIIAAIAIPNLLNAIDRGKQKRSMANMRGVATAIEAYRDSRGTYPVAPDIETLRGQLEPDYVREIGTRDGWGNPFVVSSKATSYELISTGKDGIRQGCDGGTTRRFTDDICFSDGAFTQWPRGRQF